MSIFICCIQFNIDETYDIMKLERLVSVLDENEKSRFILYLHSVNKRKDTKNIELFNCLYHNMPSKEIPTALYGKDNKRAYHALRIRLQKNLIDYLGQDGLQNEATEEVAIYKLVFLGRKYLQKQHYEIGIEFLNTAEQKALKVQHYVLLNEIYHSLIQYAHHSKKLNLASLIEVHGHNSKLLIQEEKLNMVYALIQASLSDLLYGKRQEIPSNLVGQLISQHEIELKTFTSFKALFQYIKLHLAVAQARNNYYGFIEEIIDQYEFVRSIQKDSDRQLYYHARLLYSITNTLFRIKDFKSCKLFNEKLQALITKTDFAYKDRFKYKYIVMEALCDNYQGKNSQAIIRLEKVALEKVPDFRDRYDILTCHFLFLMHAERHHEAKRLTAQTFHSDKYYEDRMGLDWLMKFKLIEVILFFELGEFDLLESRVRSFKRSFFNYLRDSNQGRVIQFFKLIERIFSNPEIVNEKEFKNHMETSIGADVAMNEDVFVQSYYAWLKSKIEKKPVYEITMGLAEMNQ